MTDGEAQDITLKLHDGWRHACCRGGASRQIVSGVCSAIKRAQCDVEQRRARMECHVAVPPARMLRTQPVP